MKRKEIWDHDTYRTDRQVILNTSIVEYDLKSANTSVAKEFKLLEPGFIKELESLDKGDRVRRLGLYKRENKDYDPVEKAAFSIARKMFMEKNHLEKSDIIAIKRDAMFVEKIVKHTKLTENLHFRPKNEYTSFMHVKVPGRFPGLELYYSHMNGVDVKGISDTIYEELHKEYMGKFVGSVFRSLEFGDDAETLRFIRNFFDRYKSKRLEEDYYREFNAESRYRYIDGTVSDRCIGLEDVDIGYNFNLILQILQKLI